MKNDAILWKCPLFCKFMVNNNMNNNKNFSDLVDEKLDENSSAGVSASAIPANFDGVRSTQKNKKKKGAITKRDKTTQSQLFI